MTDESPSLPPELLQDIIESSIARTYHSTSYDDRQATLRSLSLVSRQFRDIAQPLLGEIIDIRTESQLARLTAIGNKAFRPKELVLNHELRVETVEGLVKGAKGLGSLVIMRSAVHRNPMDLRALVERSELIHLRFYRCYFDFDCTASRPFTSLQSLTLSDSLSSAARPLLGPEQLPSLRALGLGRLAHRSDILEDANFGRLLPQLDAIIISSYTYHLANSGLFHDHLPKILVDDFGLHHHGHLLRPLRTAHHLRFGSRPRHSLDHMQAILSFIAVSRKISPLKSIYLDSSLHPTQIDSPDLSGKMRQLLEDCRRGGIEVVYEQQVCRVGDWFISEEFWSRQRRRREME